MLSNYFYCPPDNAKTSEHFHSIYTSPFLNVVYFYLVFSILQHMVNIVLYSQCSLRIIHIFTIFVGLSFLRLQLSFWIMLLLLEKHLHLGQDACWQILF